AGVDHVFDAAQLDAAGRHDPFDRVDDLAGRRVGLDAQVVLRRVHRARRTGQLRAADVLADVGRAQVERLACRVNANRVEIPAGQPLAADGAAVLRGHVFLDERGAVDAERARVRAGRLLQRPRRVEAHDAGAAPADVGLDDEGEPQALRRARRLR